MLLETVLSMLTTMCPLKTLTYRTWVALHGRRAFTMALFNVLVQWHGFPLDADRTIRLTMSEFSQSGN